MVDIVQAFYDMTEFIPEFPILNVVSEENCVRLVNDMKISNRVGIRLLEQVVMYNLTPFGIPKHSNLLQHLKDILDFSKLIKKSRISMDIMTRFQDKMDFTLVAQHQFFDQDFCEKFVDKMDLGILIKYKGNSFHEDFFIKISSKPDGTLVQGVLNSLVEFKTNLSEPFILHYYSESWSDVFKFQRSLSENFIQMHFGNARETVCRHQVLSDIMLQRLHVFHPDWDESLWFHLSLNPLADIPIELLESKWDLLETVKVCEHHGNKLREGFLKMKMEELTSQHFTALSWNKGNISLSFMLDYRNRLDFYPIVLQYYIEQDMLQYIYHPGTDPEATDTARLFSLDLVIEHQVDSVDTSFCIDMININFDLDSVITRQLLNTLIKFRQVDLNFIKRHYDLLDKDILSLSQTCLDISFIREFQDDLNFYNISLAGTAVRLGKEFCREFHEKLDFTVMNHFGAQVFLGYGIPESENEKFGGLEYVLRELVQKFKVESKTDDGIPQDTPKGIPEDW